jgi:hypothetical protein
MTVEVLTAGARISPTEGSSMLCTIVIHVVEHQEIDIALTATLTHGPISVHCLSFDASIPLLRISPVFVLVSEVVGPMFD